ncbi:MAG: phytanoyl-CoA dioxygenase family protein [Gammaproteobacteria bacterium]|nr:phytanoyl-CoA dioxygenase family protein [Gammaproteobacteria bacterium]
MDWEAALVPLTEEQKRNFVRDGFLHIAEVVPSRLVSRARRAINNSLGAGIDPEQMARFNNQTFCPELRDDPRLLRLATTPEVWSHVRALLGDHRVVRPKDCQIALRFPLPEGTPRRAMGGHIDGYHTPRNGVPDDGVVRNFTMLLGIMLSDVPMPFSGNFTAWPGTHRRLERYFRGHGVNTLDGGGVMSLGLRLPKPVPVTGRAGDIVLAHYQMAHAVSPNLSGDIRYMCFFRLSVRGLANHRVESMLDIWRDWPKLRPGQQA